MKKKLLFALCGALALGMLLPLTACGTGLRGYFNKVTSKDLVDKYEQLIKDYGYDQKDAFNQDYRLEWEEKTTVSTQQSKLPTEQTVKKAVVKYDKQNRTATSTTVTSIKSSTDGNKTKTANVYVQQKSNGDIYDFDPFTETYIVKLNGSGNDVYVTVSDYVDCIGTYEFNLKYIFRMIYRIASDSEQTQCYWDGVNVLTVASTPDYEAPGSFVTTEEVIYQIIPEKNKITFALKVTQTTEDDFEGPTQTVTELYGSVTFRDITIEKQDLSNYTEID